MNLILRRQKAILPFAYKMAISPSCITQWNSLYNTYVAVNALNHIYTDMFKLLQMPPALTGEGAFAH